LCAAQSALARVRMSPVARRVIPRS
jgi:hypothetical protein